MNRFSFFLLIFVAGCADESTQLISNPTELWRIEPCRSTMMNGDTFAYTYVDGQLSTIKSEDGNYVSTYQWASGYPTRVVTKSTLLGDTVVEFVFDNAGALKRQKLIDADQKITTQNYLWPKDAATHGKSLAAQEYVVEYEQGGAVREELVAYTVDESGKLTSAIHEENAKRTLVVEYAYDADGRLSREEHRSPMNGELWFRHSYEYDCQ